MNYCVNDGTTGVFSRFSFLPTLVTRSSSIDIFQAWIASSFSKVVLQRFSEYKFPDATIQKMMESRLHSIASFTAHVHTSSSKMLDQQFGCSQMELFTPKTFLDFLDMFTKCLHDVWKKEKVKRNGIFFFERQLLCMTYYSRPAYACPTKTIDF